MLGSKKIAAILMVILVVLILTLSLSIFVNTLTRENLEKEISSESIFYSLPTDDSDSQESEAYRTADMKYDKSLYSQDIKSFEAAILPYNLDADKNYLPDTLFVGDSNTAGLFSFGYMPLQNVLAKPSMAIQAVRNKEFVWFSGYDKPLTIVSSISVLKPRRIIINFGTNNTVGTSIKDFTAIFKSTLNDITTSYPYADIIVAAVLPVGRYRENTRIKMQTIDSFNVALARLCIEDGYKFLNTSETFKDPSTGFMKPNYVAKDGVHLNSVGYNALLEYITDHKLLTQDKRPPRGFIPKRVSTKPQQSSPPEYDNEPGEEAIFPPSVGDSSTTAQSSVIKPSGSSVLNSGTGDSADFSSDGALSEGASLPQEENSFSDNNDNSTDQIFDPFL